MRHRHANAKLGRTSAHRKRLFQHLCEALFRSFQIQTTTHKAKAAKPFAEWLITLARKGEDPQAQRKIRTVIQDKLAYQTLMNRIGPANASRNGGYTRVLKLGRRPGDGAEVAILELVGREELGVPPGKPPKKKETKEKAGGGSR